MREIKFRAIHDEGKSMVEPVEFHDLGAMLEDPKWHVMQYTGLHDKNGKEIYEGDLVQIGPEVYPAVVWDTLNAQFILATHYFHLGGGQSIFYEVIGNIYENPELLSDHGTVK